MSFSAAKRSRDVWHVLDRRKWKERATTINRAFTQYVCEAQARGCTWESMDAFCQALHTMWRHSLVDVCHLYDHPPDESLCTIECMRDGCITVLHTDKVESLSLYGCVKHGSFHRCTGRLTECSCQFCDDHMQLVCIFSGVSLGYENVGYSGNESRRRTDGGETNAATLSHDRSVQIRSFKRMQGARNTFTNHALEKRRREAQQGDKRRKVDETILEETLPECKHAALAYRIAFSAAENARQDKEDKLRTSRLERASAGEANGRTRNTAAWVYNEKAKENVRCCIDLVLRHVLFDKKRRTDLNRNSATQAVDNAVQAVRAYHAECKRRKDIPNAIRSAERYRNELNKLRLLTEPTSDPVRREILISRITKLWKLCNTSPHYKENGGAASRDGCTLKQFATAALYVMASGFTYEDETNYTHILVPKDTDLDLALHLPPESMLSLFGASKKEQENVNSMRPSASSSMLLETGDLVHESEFVAEWRREPALSGSVGRSMQAFGFDHKDVTKGRNFITKALSSFGTDIAMLQRIGSI